MSVLTNHLPPAAESSPALSVLIPLYDLRESLDQALHNWRQQALPVGQRLEIVVSYCRRNPTRCDPTTLRGRVDRLVATEINNEAVLYNAAARASQGAVLLFTEPHALPNRLAAQRTLEYLQPSRPTCDIGSTGPHAADAVILGSQGIVCDDLSELEERLSHQEHPAVQALGVWRRVGFRGFAIRRECFWEYGPLEESCYRFAEIVLALRLHLGGRRIAVMTETVIGHVHSSSTIEQKTAMYTGALGQCAFRERDPLRAEQHMGALPGWTERAVHYRPAARVLCRSLLSELLGGHRRRLAAGELLAHLPAALFGSSWHRWWSCWHSHIAERRLLSYLRPKSARATQREPLPEAALDAFLAARQAWTLDGVSEYVLHTPLSPAVELSPSRPVTAADLEESSRFGFAETTTWEGRPARWTRADCVGAVPAGGW